MKTTDTGHTETLRARIFELDRAAWEAQGRLKHADAERLRLERDRVRRQFSALVGPRARMLVAKDLRDIEEAMTP